MIEQNYMKSWSLGKCFIIIDIIMIIVIYVHIMYKKKIIIIIIIKIIKKIKISLWKVCKISATELLIVFVSLIFNCPFTHK